MAIVILWACVNAQLAASRLGGQLDMLSTCRGQAAKSGMNVGVLVCGVRSTQRESYESRGKTTKGYGLSGKYGSSSDSVFCFSFATIAC